MNTTTCSYHCRGCDSCFSSLAAFDKHRVGKFETDRHCDIPDDELTEGFESVRGECRDADYPNVREVSVWALAGSRERMAKVFRDRR